MYLCLCVLTRELRTKRVRVEGFVCYEGSAATHIENSRATAESWSLIKVRSEPQSKNTLVIQQIRT